MPAMVRGVIGGGILAGGMLLAGACGDDAAVPPLPILPPPPEETEPVRGASSEPEDGYRVVDVQESGTVFGRIRYRGVRPGLAPFDVPRQHDVCGFSQPSPVFSATPAGGFADVVVWVDLDEGEAPPPQEAPALIDQVDCRYVPHVSAVHRGDRILFRNGDPVLHNVRATWLDGEEWFDVGEPREGDAVIQAPQRTGIVRVVCDAGHPWMLGFIHVFDHPYHAVTDAEGAFRIEGVPAGTHRVRLWHAGLERRGWSSGRPVYGDPLTAEAEVEVAPGAEVEIDLTLSMPSSAAEG
jgi:plastocyanin